MRETYHENGGFSFYNIIAETEIDSSVMCSMVADYFRLNKEKYEDFKCSTIFDPDKNGEMKVRIMYDNGFENNMFAIIVARSVVRVSEESFKLQD